MQHVSDKSQRKELFLTERLFTQVFFSYPEAAVRSCFFKTCVLKRFAIFTGKRLFWSLFILRPQGLQLY